MKWLRTLTGVLAAAIALLAAGLALSIYFGWNGEGQMYTAELVSAKLHILLLPVLIWLALLAVTAVAELRQPKKPEFAKKPKYPELPKWGRYTAIGTAALSALWILIYLVQTSHFESRDLEATVGMMLLNIVPAAVILLVSGYFLQRDASPRPAAAQKKMLLAVRIGLAVLAVGLITAGVLNGGMRDVLVKAINICTECIGLG